MKLPNGDRATIPMEKLTGYCLNLNHPKGKNKARVFQSRLGITAANVDRLRALIQQAAIEGDVVEQNVTELGQGFKVDWAIPDTKGLQLRTTWEITAGASHLCNLVARNRPQGRVAAQKWDAPDYSVFQQSKTNYRLALLNESMIC